MANTTRDQNLRDQKPIRDGKPAKGEISDNDLDKVSGGRDAASGLPTGKRMHTVGVSADPCEGGE